MFFYILVNHSNLQFCFNWMGSSFEPSLFDYLSHHHGIFLGPLILDWKLSSQRKGDLSCETWSCEFPPLSHFQSHWQKWAKAQTEKEKLFQNFSFWFKYDNDFSHHWSEMVLEQTYVSRLDAQGGGVRGGGKAWLDISYKFNFGQLVFTNTVKILLEVEQDWFVSIKKRGYS